MSGQGDQLDKMSTLLAEVAAQLEQVKLQGARCEEQHQDLTERMSQLEARMDAPQSSAAVLIPTQLQPQSFTVPLAQGVDLNAPATVGQCMELVQMAMQQKVAPALGAVYSSLSTSQVRTNERVGNLEQQVRALRIRTAWAEKDMLFSQIEQAKRTIVCRNFPTWQTEADRRLTVEKALAKAGLWNIDGMWDLATTRLDTGTPGKPELSATSILTVPSLTVRKRILEVSDRVYPWYFHQEKPGTGEEPKEPEDAQDGSEGTAEKTPAESSQAAGSKEPAKTYEYKGGGPVKLSPGVTQFERRLASPLQGLMNAYRAAFSKFTKEPLVPRWKTLALVDSKEAWLGRIVYRRGGPSQTTSTGTLTDWECEIHIPEEHATKLLETWRSIWYDQLRQQVNQTTFLTKAIPEYNEGEDEGLDHWIARPSVHRVDVASQMKRTHSDAVSAVSGISPSTAMPPPQPTKARPSYYPFSSQAELETAVEEAKIAHINHGGVPTDYPQEAWESWCIKRCSESCSSVPFGDEVTNSTAAASTPPHHHQISQQEPAPPEAEAEDASPQPSQSNTDQQRLDQQWQSIKDKHFVLTWGGGVSPVVESKVWNPANGTPWRTHRSSRGTRRGPSLLSSAGIPGAN
ncbi:unnamed protein product [Symbiodinium sp. CCMP2592]|nr:unnamed protein product [Symbiodinium sp. CCMP2592]